MRKSVLILTFIFGVSLFAQESIDIQTCYKLAVENYPSSKQKKLFYKIASLEKDNLNSQYLPKVNLIGQATYQSDVTKIDMDIPIPNLDIEFPEIDKDQYRIGITIDQMIWDGGIISNQKRIAELNGDYNIQNSEVELYQLRKRVNDLFYGILKLQENIKLLETAIEVMNAKYKQIAVAVESGMALQSNADIIKAEILIAEQNLEMLNDSKKTAAESLSILINKDIKNLLLLMPEVDASKQEAFNRPEYRLFQNSKDQTKQIKELSDSKYLPKIFAFGQAMYGKPGLNMFDPDFQPFYIIGIKASWNFWNWGSSSREKEIADIQHEIIDSKESTFTKNINIASEAMFNEIEKYQKMIERDKDIIELKENIVEISSSQLDNGVITSTEYIAEFNALLKARISYQLHQVELSEAKVNYLTHVNNAFVNK
jgi:outer membrane protein TolC